MINTEISQQLSARPNTPAAVALVTIEPSTEISRPTFPQRSSSTFSLEEGFLQVGED